MGIKWGTGEPRHHTSASNWAQPLVWERKAQSFKAEHGRRQRVFCASLADVFDNKVPTEWRHDLFQLIADTPSLDWILLTKRICNARPMIEESSRAVYKGAGEPTWPWHNVWLGATVVNQEEADRDIPKLLAVPARVRFLSIEPMLGPVFLTNLNVGLRTPLHDIGVLPPSHDHIDALGFLRGIDWVICGGESGPGARQMEIAWARSLAQQCKAASVAFYMKQLGAQPRGWCAARLHVNQKDEADLANDYCDLYEASECSRSCGRCALMNDKKGVDMMEWPEDLRIREFPTTSTPTA